MLCPNFPYPKLLHFFEEISAIPRPSYHEAAIADYLVDFARQRGLACVRDQANNVLIDLPASAGYEAEEPILLQGHTDMVCEKNDGVLHDFLKDPLELYEQDGLIRAKGTTLGADDGVAVAAMLALLDGESDAHPALQCLFTASEEVGLDGVKAFDYRNIRARRMINMDSADESCIVVGCAGGLRSSVVIPVAREAFDVEGICLRLSGLCGGHSGEDIHRGRANANKLMGRILYFLLSRHDGLRLSALRGGTKDNAIPREAEAVLVGASLEAVEADVQRILGEIRRELCRDDAALVESVERVARVSSALTRQSTEQVVFLPTVVADGVLAMSQELKGLVEFSRNLGIVSLDETGAEMIFSSRSALDSQIDRSAAELDAYAARLGGTTRHYNRYPGWNYDERSDMRRRYADAYRSVFGQDPRVEVIHAGLECGLIKQALPDMDLISCGPIVTDLHSPAEALHVASFARFFEIILKLLKDTRTH